MDNDTLLQDNTTEVGDGLGPHFPISQWTHHFEFVFLLIVILIGAPGNLMLILIQWKNKKRSTTDTLLMAMACYEFCCSSINAPWKFIKIFDPLWVAIGSPFLCKFTLFSINFDNLGSAQMLAAIAADRYIKTCMPLSTFYGDKQAEIICGVVVVTTTFLSLPHIGMIYWDEVWLFCRVTPWWLFDPRKYGMSLNTVFMSAFIIVVFSYMRINFFLRARYRQKVKKRTQSTTKLTSHMEKEPITTELTSTTAVSGTSEFPDTSGQSSQDEKAVSLAGQVGKGGHGDDQRTNEQVAIDMKVETKSKTSKSQKKVSKSSTKLETEARNLNKLTLTMSMITLVYIFTGILNWILFISGPIFGWDVWHLSFSFPLVNCISNPILLFLMTERFRSSAKKILFKR